MTREPLNKSVSGELVEPEQTKSAAFSGFGRSPFDRFRENGRPIQSFRGELRRNSLMSVLIVSVSLCTGCVAVTEYQPTGAMLQVKQHMSREEAISVLRNAITAKPGEGLCDASFGVQPKTVPHVTSTGYSHKAWRHGELVSSSSSGTLATGMRMKHVYKKEFYDKHTRFSELTKVHIYKPHHSYLCSEAYPPRFTTNGNLIVQLVVSSPTNVISVEVGPTDVDRLLAALSILAPQVKMTAGIGMSTR